VSVAAPDRLRERLPALAGVVHLAACSHGPRSAALDDALRDMLGALAAGPPWPAFEAQAVLARQGFAALVGAAPGEVALLPNASVGAHQVAASLDWSRRPLVLTTRAEFPSVAHVWLAQAQRGAVVRFVDPPEPAGAVAAPDPDAVREQYLAALAAEPGRTGLVSVPLVTYRDGVRLPVADIARAARRAGARVFVDAYQALGTEPVDVGALGCD
jgi:selenocysteine lyase/cysteine desulfurase